MKINRLTITGADGKVKHQDLVDLQKEFPFVEWGILFSRHTWGGAKRVPDMDWIKELGNYHEQLTLSAHLCGTFAKKVLIEHKLETVQSMWHMFKRFQLNHNFTENPVDIAHVTNLLQMVSDLKFILQMNKSNAETVTAIATGARNNVDVLYDASGGRGNAIKIIPEPFVNYTGYAGGLNIDNIESVCRIISNHPSNAEVWVDLESGARNSEDEFDLPTVRRILQAVQPFIK